MREVVSNSEITHGSLGDGDNILNMKISVYTTPTSSSLVTRRYKIYGTRLAAVEFMKTSIIRPTIRDYNHYYS